ncbi:MAG: type II secretion system F family protein [Phycisphaerae bacterium]
MIVVVFLLVMFVLAVGAAMSIFLRGRKLRIRGLVHTLALLVGQNIPLGAGLRAAAAHEPRRMRRIYEHLADHLENGVALSAAVMDVEPACPGAVYGALRAAETGGTLPTVLRELAAEQRRSAATPRLVSPVIPYLVLLLLIPVYAAVFGLVVGPKFRDIFRDFGVALPAMTELLLSTSAVLASNSIAFTALLGVIAAITFQALFGRHMTRRLPDRRQPLNELIDTLAWHLPGARQLAETRAWAAALPLLEAAIRAGHDLPAAARVAACADANIFARRRLRAWANAIEGGAAPASAARHLGMSPKVVNAVAAGGAREAFAAALGYLAVYFESVRDHRARVLAEALTPAVVLVAGAAALAAALGMFLPIQALTEAVMETIY